MRKMILLILLLVISPLIMGYTVENKDVSVTVGDVEVLAYDVEITWDAMEFTYIETVNFVWDNNMYEKEKSTYRWSTSSNKIKINNKSAMPINMELMYLREEESINGTFDVEKSTILSNESVVSKLMLNGELLLKTVNYVKIGRINLLIS